MKLIVNGVLGNSRGFVSYSVKGIKKIGLIVLLEFLSRDPHVHTAWGDVRLSTSGHVTNTRRRKLSLFSLFPLQNNLQNLENCLIYHLQLISLPKYNFFPYFTLFF